MKIRVISLKVNLTLYVIFISHNMKVMYDPNSMRPNQSIQEPSLLLTSSFKEGESETLKESESYLNISEGDFNISESESYLVFYLVVKKLFLSAANTGPAALSPILNMLTKEKMFRQCLKKKNNFLLHKYHSALSLGLNT